MSISYVIGNVLDFPSGLLCHVCNDLGKWGAGFTGKLSKKWKEPEDKYRYFATYSSAFRLGKVQFVQVETDKIIANMIAQKGLATKCNPVVIQYDHLRTCLLRVAQEAVELKLPIVMPRIGCGLGGGKWETVEKIIEETLVASGVDVTVYDLSKG